MYQIRIFILNSEPDLSLKKKSHTYPTLEREKNPELIGKPASDKRIFILDPDPTKIPGSYQNPWIRNSTLQTPLQSIYTQ